MKKYILEYNTHDEVIALLGREIPHEHLEHVSTIILDLYEDEYLAIKEAGYNIVENNYDIEVLYTPPTFATTGEPPPFNEYMGVPASHAAGFDGTGVSIGLLGSGTSVGAAATVPTLIFQDYTGLGMVDISPSHEGRGTLCIGQMLQLNTGVPKPYGIAKGCQLYNIKCYPGGSAEFIQGINYCIANNIDIINISFNLGSGMNTAINAALAAGIIVVCASGNSLATQVAHPANIPGVICLSGLQCNTGVLFGSYLTPDSSTNVTIVNYHGGHYQTFSGGTSQAAWMLSGILAIYKQKYPSLTTEKAIHLLKRRAKQLTGYTYNRTSNTSTKGVLENYETGAGFLAPINT